MTIPGFGSSLADDDFHVSLVESLRFAVPMYLDQLRDVHPARLVGDARWCAWAIGERGASLMFTDCGQRTRGRRESAALAFEGLARGLAAIALVEGHVTYAGLHWCTAPHDNCPTAPRPVPKPVTAEEIAVVVALADEYEAAVARNGYARRADWPAPTKAASR